MLNQQGFTHLNNMENLLHGDCLSLLPDIPDNSVDAIIADLPYGITQAKWDYEIDIDALWRQYSRIRKDNSPIVLFASQPFTSKLISSNLEEYKYCWYWEKEKGTGFLNSKIQPLRCVEEICVFYKKAGKYNPQMVPLEKPYKHKLPTKKSEVINDVASFNEEVKYKIYTHSCPKNLIRFSRDNSNKGILSTQKPIALMEYLVKTYTNEGEVVMDNTMGSGTTGVACKKLNRQFLGMEINEEMFNIAKIRIEHIQGRETNF